jgi:hypothetical protein
VGRLFAALNVKLNDCVVLAGMATFLPGETLTVNPAGRLVTSITKVSAIPELRNDGLKTTLAPPGVIEMLPVVGFQKKSMPCCNGAVSGAAKGEAPAD